MVCCLKPNCQNPVNPDGTEFCLSCKTKLLPILSNRYCVICPLSSGVSQNFLAKDREKPNEMCVIKQLIPPIKDTSAYQITKQLFQAEAQRLQQIGEHPQIPTLYAYFEQDCNLYLVHESLAGQTLSQELEQEGTFSEHKIWDLLSELLPLLYFVHKHQVIHRHINPDNIIRRQNDGKLMLINFPIAKQLSHFDIDAAQTTSHLFGDIPLEKINNLEGERDTDFCDLGLTCLYLLSGIDPLHEWATHNQNWVGNWRRYVTQQSISEELAQVLDKLLQKNSQYHQLMAEQRQLPIQSLQGDVPVLATPTLSVATQNTLIPFSHNQKPLISTVATDSAGYLTERKPNAIATKKPLNNKVLVVGSSLLILLAAYTYWQLTQIPTLTGHADEVNTIAFTPDGQNFATGSDDRTIKIWNAKTLQEIRTLTGHLNWVYFVTISPDGQILVSAGKDNTVRVWNLNAGKELFTHRDHKSYVSGVDISPDGQKFASSSYDKTVKLWDLNTGKEIRTLRGHSREVLSVKISPDGQKLVTGSGDNTVKVWDINTGKEIRTLRGHTAVVWSVDISPDNQLIASASDDRTVKLWNLNTGREIRTFRGHTSDVDFVTFNPDGKKIATASDDKTIKIWKVAAGEAIATLKGHTAAVWSVGFSPDGNTLISTSEDKTIKVWHVPQ